MTYEARANGGPWRPISPMQGESLDEVFRQLGSGAEVRCVVDRAERALDRLRDLEHKWMTLSERVADAEESLARARAGSLEALEARVSQLEAVREMADADTCACGTLSTHGVAKVAGRYLCVACGRERVTW